MAENTKPPVSPDGRFTSESPRYRNGGRRKMPEAELTMLGDAWPKAVKRLIEGLDATQIVDGQPEPHWKERREYACAIRDTLFGKPPQAITDGDGGPVLGGLIILPAEKEP